MTHSELAWEFAELFGDLETEDINKVLAQNVPLETLEFFNSYGESFAKAEQIEGATRQRLPNLLILGYLLRVLEERLLDGGPRAVESDGAPAPVGPYSPAVVCGDWVFASGQIPLRPDGSVVDGDIEGQTEQVLANLAAVLEAAGSALDHVVRTTVYLVDLAEFPRMNEIYARHFHADPPPARSTVQVSALPKNARIEIDCIALRDVPA